jgi:hypothetical protein
MDEREAAALKQQVVDLVAQEPRRVRVQVDGRVEEPVVVEVVFE